jgi:hypothetical protein
MGSSDSSCEASTNISLTTETDEFTVTEKYESFRFTLHNQTECQLSIQPRKGWKIERRSASGWEQVATRGGDGTDRTLTGGDEHNWVLGLSEHPTPYGQTTTFLFVDLSDGLYRFTVTGILETGTEVTYTAQFRLRRNIPSENRTDE